MEIYTRIIPVSPAEVGPDGTGSYRYAYNGILSEAKYHNAASARFDAARVQRVTVEGFLVPDSRCNPGVN